MRKLKINGYCVEHEDGGEHPRGIRCPMILGRLCNTECAWFNIIEVCGGEKKASKHCFCRDDMIGELGNSDEEYTAIKLRQEKKC